MFTQSAPEAIIEGRAYGIWGRIGAAFAFGWSGGLETLAQYHTNFKERR